jgi:hypothetical protein
VPKALDSIVGRVPQELIQYIREDAERKGIAASPAATTVSETDLSQLKQILMRLPSPVMDLARSKVQFIGLVSGLGSSGYSHSTYSSEGIPEGGIIVFDQSILKKSSNEWFTERENTPFKCAEPERLVGKMSRDRKDVLASVQYIFFHELAHVFSEGTSINPYLGAPARIGEIESSNFGKISWSVSDEKYVSKFDSKFQKRPFVKYYASAADQLPCSDQEAIYEQLGGTDFPALYAVSSPFEDFAESFANFVHVAVLKRPFSLAYRSKHGKAKHYMPCWGNVRCQEKEAYLKEVYRYLSESSSHSK